MKAAQQPRFPDTCFCGSKNSLSRSLPTDLQILLAYRIHSLWYSFSSQNLHISHPLQGDNTNLGGLEKIEAFSCYLCWFLACSRFTDSGGRWTRRSADRGIGVADRPSQALLFFFFVGLLTPRTAAAIAPRLQTERLEQAIGSEKSKVVGHFKKGWVRG